MNTFSIIFFAFYFLIFFFYGYVFCQRFAPKNPQQTTLAKIQFFIRNTKMWLSFVLAFCSAMTLLLPIGSLTEWILSPQITKLLKIGQDDVILLKSEPHHQRIYTDLVYRRNGVPYSIFWDKKKTTFFIEKVSKEKTKELFALKKSPFFFEENSNFSRLPLSKTFNDGKTIVMRSEEKKIRVSWQGKPEKLFPSSFEEKSQLGLDYALGDGMFFMSYIPRGAIFNHIFMYQQDLTARSLMNEKTAGHFHSPYYWPAKKALFFTGIEREKNKNGEKVFISSLYLQSFADKNKKIILKAPLAQSKSLSLFILKISGSHDGKFFAHHDAITEKNFLVFYWMKNKNYPFTLEWSNLKRISSFAISPVVKSKEKHPNAPYQISLLGEDNAGRQTIITSQIIPEKAKASLGKNIIEIVLTLILIVLSGALYSIGLLIAVKSNPKQ